MVSIERREGIVRSVHHGKVVVRIQQQGACTGCHAKEFCCSTDCADRDIIIQTDHTHFVPGDAVIVEGRDSVGHWAVFLSFVIPIILLVGGLFVSLSIWSMTEAWSIFIALVLVLLYYGLLSLCEPWLRRIMTFEIIKAE